jgi:hypothetical protein
MLYSNMFWDHPNFVEILELLVLVFTDICTGRRIIVGRIDRRESSWMSITIWPFGALPRGEVEFELLSAIPWLSEVVEANAAKPANLAALDACQCEPAHT